MEGLNQGQEFLCYCIVGMFLCFIFDIFRSSRYVFKTSDLITYIEDGIFLSLSAVIVVSSILLISKGMLRFYIILDVCLGILVYSLTISKVCVIMFKSIFKAIRFLVNKIMEMHKWESFLNQNFIS